MDGRNYHRVTLPSRYLIESAEIITGSKSGEPPRRQMDYTIKKIYPAQELSQAIKRDPKQAKKDLPRRKWKYGKEKKEQIRSFPLEEGESFENYYQKMQTALTEAGVPVSANEAMALVAFANTDSNAPQQGGIFQFAEAIFKGFWITSADSVKPASHGQQEVNVMERVFPTRPSQTAEADLHYLEINRINRQTLQIQTYTSVNQSAPTISFRYKFYLRNKNGSFFLTVDENDYEVLIRNDVWRQLLLQAQEKLTTTKFTKSDIFFFIPLLSNRTFNTLFFQKLRQQSYYTQYQVLQRINWCFPNNNWRIPTTFIDYPLSPIIWAFRKGGYLGAFSMTALLTGLFVACPILYVKYKSAAVLAEVGMGTCAKWGAWGAAVSMIGSAVLKKGNEWSIGETADDGLDTTDINSDLRASDSPRDRQDDHFKRPRPNGNGLQSHTSATMTMRASSPRQSHAAPTDTQRKSPDEGDRSSNSSNSSQPGGHTRRASEPNTPVSAAGDEVQASEGVSMVRAKAKSFAAKHAKKFTIDARREPLEPYEPKQPQPPSPEIPVQNGDKRASRSPTRSPSS